MRDFFQQYLAVILDQRDWSWTLVCAAFFCIALLIRRIFLRPLITKSKTLAKPNFHEIKANYLNKCALGWFFLLGATALIGFMWFSNLPFPLSTKDVVLLFCIFILALVSIQLHLAAYAAACIKATKKLEDSQKVI